MRKIYIWEKSLKKFFAAEGGGFLYFDPEVAAIELLACVLPNYLKHSIRIYLSYVTDIVIN